jgi:hypothetical protein
VSSLISNSAAVLSSPQPQVGEVQPVWGAHPHLAAEFLPLLTSPPSAPSISSAILLGANIVPLRTSSMQRLLHRGGSSSHVATASSCSIALAPRSKSVGATVRSRTKDAASFPPRPN